MSARVILSGAKTISTLGTAINSYYTANPRVANACIGCVTFCLGDFLAQYVECRSASPKQKYKPDAVRAASVGCFGLFMNGFFLHNWYSLLDKVVGSSMKSKAGIAMKIVADQLVYGPFAIAAFFCFASARSSTNIASAKVQFLSKMEECFLPTYAADCAVWPLANFVNFRYIPLVYRPSYISVVQVVWQTYLSVVANTHGLQADELAVKKVP
ncbi:hypothetical protein B484DRAFT_445636 [Ochromonadaceae sp. CCMP2298]|nr:hypothetical protein B484DRAFT_445636 [Ochromonadaceae sp. CCMP2298]